MSPTQLLYSTPIVYWYIPYIVLLLWKLCQQNWYRIQNTAQVLIKNTAVCKHRYPFHKKALCVCLWARPSGRDSGTRVSFTAPPDLSDNYSLVCQHAMWRPEPGECRNHYTQSGKTSGRDLWGLIISSSKKEGRKLFWHHQCLQPNKTFITAVRLEEEVTGGSLASDWTGDNITSQW